MFAACRHLTEQLTRSPLSKGRPGSRVTFFPSQKNGGPVACGNLQQADFCVLLEYQPEVRSYQCRPPTLRRGDLRYKADFLVFLNNGREVYHKFQPTAASPEAFSAGQKQAVETMLFDNGLFFHWLIPEDLPHPLVHHNLRFLYHHGFGSSRKAASRVRRQVLAQPERQMSFKALLASGAIPTDISHAIFLDELRIRLEQRITLETMIYGGHYGHC
jgi:hypothetical protein